MEEGGAWFLTRDTAQSPDWLINRLFPLMSDVFCWLTRLQTLSNIVHTHLSWQDCGEPCLFVQLVWMEQHGS